jgi:hypothetical protein
MSDFCEVWTNSTGSSIVMIRRRFVRLRKSIMAASVVLLPLPVVPVTNTSPRCSSAISWTAGGSIRASNGLIESGITRATRLSRPSS